MKQNVQLSVPLKDRKSIAAVTKVLFIVLVLLIWQIITGKRDGDEFTLIPSISQIAVAFWDGIVTGEIITHLLYSLKLIGIGILIGVVLAFLLTALYMVVPLFSHVLDAILTIMHPLPGIALLPIVMLLVGLGAKAIIIIIVHSILWPIIVNAVTGFKSVPKTQLELGRNLGMGEFKLVYSVMIPNAFPHILSGLKIAWSRSWRALVAAEMVFGATGVAGGLGWFIYKKRYLMEVTPVFAGLVVIIIVGMIVDEVLFRQIEKNTVIKWGMSK